MMAIPGVNVLAIKGLFNALVYQRRLLVPHLEVTGVHCNCSSCMSGLISYLQIFHVFPLNLSRTSDLKVSYLTRIIL